MRSTFLDDRCLMCESDRSMRRSYTVKAGATGQTLVGNIPMRKDKYTFEACESNSFTTPFECSNGHRWVLREQMGNITITYDPRSVDRLIDPIPAGTIITLS